MPAFRAAACLALLFALPLRAAEPVAALLPPEAMVEGMLRAARLGPADLLVDLGSGDGRTALAAARRFGARATGVDSDAALVALNTQRAQSMGLSARVRFVRGEVADTDLSNANVVVLSTVGEPLRLVPALLALKPGSRVLALQPGMGEWAPDDVLTLDKHNAYLWIVPALANGVWQLHLHGPGLRRDDRLRISQRFQAVGGELLAGGDALPLTDATLRGDLITFAVSDRRGNLRRFFGHIRGDRISGKSQTPGGATHVWEARRVAPR
jgi:SAM-dependent methyltransferase